MAGPTLCTSVPSSLPHSSRVELMPLPGFLALGKDPGGPAARQASGRQLSGNTNKSRQVMKKLAPASEP